jgi:hypothetical protein
MMPSHDGTMGVDPHTEELRLQRSVFTMVDVILSSPGDFDRFTRYRLREQHRVHAEIRFVFAPEAATQ